MAKKRAKVSLAPSIKPQTGDLEKLFSTAEDVEQAAGLHLLALRVEAIKPDPDQPRQTFPEDSLQELSSSIKQDGVIQPIEVTETEPDTYIIVHGERRWRAAKLAGLETIPAVVRRRDYDTVTRFVRQMVENIQREDLNDVDRAAGLVRLKELMQEELDRQLEEHGGTGKPHQRSMTWAKVGKRLGYSRQRIHQLIRLLDLPEEIKEAVRQGQLSERETRIYHGLQARQQRELHIARSAEELSPKEAKQVAKQLKESPDKPVREAIWEVRTVTQREEGASKQSFGATFEEGTAVPPAPAQQRQLTQPKKTSRRNAQNINRVHWARDHLSRIQREGLDPQERRILVDLLGHLQQNIDQLIDTLQPD